MSRYSLAQIRAVMRGDMAAFFAEGPHPASNATAKAGSRPAAKAPTPTIATAKGFMDLVADEMKAGKTKAQAVRAVAIARPDLHSEYLRTFNAKAAEIRTLDRRRAELQRDLRSSHAARARR